MSVICLLWIHVPILCYFRNPAERLSSHWSHRGFMCARSWFADLPIYRFLDLRFATNRCVRDSILV